MKQMTPAALERAMKLQDVNVTGNGETDHVVSGGRDTWDQLPTDAPSPDAIQT